MRLALPVLISAVLLAPGCTYTTRWIQDARIQRAVAAGSHIKALTLIDSVVDSDRDADRVLDKARQGARIAHLDAKDYARAVRFYSLIVMKSPDPEERKSAQRFVAQISFDNLQNFDRAVIEYERLLKLDHRPEEAFRYRLNLSKAHFQLNNMDQALSEIEALLSVSRDPDQEFEARVLKASVMMTNRLLEAAAAEWLAILKAFPDRAQRENVALNLVVCYEEMKAFDKAIGVLEEMKGKYPNPDFLEARITRLKERQMNQPGAQGWKR